MITQHGLAYLRPDFKQSSTGELFSKVLENIQKELDGIYKAFYSYPVNEAERPGIDNIFRIIERTWVGVLNNALLKSDSRITTLQEFSVWSEERSIGRCDLLFRYEAGVQRFDFVTEAKLFEFTNRWKNETAEQFYNSILRQAFNYYDTEKKYYDTYKSEVWLVAFVVEWIRNSALLNEAVKIMSNWSQDTDNQTDFLTLYIGNDCGAFVYGKLVRASDFKPKVF